MRLRWLPVCAVLSMVACAAPRPLSSESKRLMEEQEKRGPAKKAEYLRSPDYAVQYGLFRDLVPKPWGEGRVLCAFSRHELGFESQIRSLAAGSGPGILYVEHSRNPDEGLRRVVQIDQNGVILSSSPLSGAFDEMRVSRLAGSDVLLVRRGDDMFAVDLSSNSRWRGSAKALSFAAFDAEGDGKPGIVTYYSLDGGLLTVYDGEGALRWSRAGYLDGFGLGAAKVPGRKGELILRISGNQRDVHVEALDAKGSVVLSSTVSGMDLSYINASGIERDGTVLASVGYGKANSRSLLHVWRLEAGGLRRVSETELGWAAVDMLLLADLNGDGTQEILLGGNDGWVLVFAPDGRLLAEHKLGGKITQMANADLTGDGIEEAVISLGSSIPPQIYVVGVIPDPGPWHP